MHAGFKLTDCCGRHLIDCNCGEGKECETCHDTGLHNITIHTDNGDYDADDQPCPDCDLGTKIELLEKGMA